MATYLYGQYSDFDTLVIDFKSKHGSDIHVSYLKLDDNPLVTSQNAEAWVRYLHRKIKELITPEAINYLDNSWDQVMAWRNDGRYNIDRSALPLGSSKNQRDARI